MAYNKSDLVSKIAQKSNLTKAQAEAAVNAFQDVFVEAMQSGEGLKLTGLFSADPGDLRRAHLRRLPAEEGRDRVSPVRATVTDFDIMVNKYSP